MRVRFALAVLLALAAGRPACAAQGPTVFAAASMKTALDAIADAWKAQTGEPVVVSYGSSGTLAKQIAAGAPADVFISADEAWMDDLAKAGALKAGTRLNLVGNTLVLVEPADADLHLKLAHGVDLAGAIGDGKLAVCTVVSCPAGIYGKQALEALGIWPAVEPKLAQADNVRAALVLVARGEAKLGIVYGTDAKAEPRVKVVDTFPPETHAQIVYPVALLKTSTSPSAAAFESYLRGASATRILAGQGFKILGR